MGRDSPPCARQEPGDSGDLVSNVSQAPLKLCPITSGIEGVTLGARKAYV